MLKLTYTEFGLHLERVTVSLETLVSQRVVLALRMGQTLHVEPSRAAFLLSIEVPGFAVRHPQQSWWLDECDRPKGGCPC